MSLFIAQFKETLYSILPITAIILILNFTLTPLDDFTFTKFIIGTIFILIGMPIFLFGIEISITPIGEQVSEALVNTNKLWLILLGGGLFGLIVTVAEPDLHILAGQVRDITSNRFNSSAMIIIVSAGVGLMVSLAIFRILKSLKVNHFMVIIYSIIFILGIFTEPDFLAIAFDASGNTTGSVSVPFILALAVGISSMTRSQKSEDSDGFGTLGIASTGAILAVMLQGIITGSGSISGSLPIDRVASNSISDVVFTAILQFALESLVAIAPILGIYIIAELIWIKQSKRKVRRILVGSLYTYIGLVIFLSGINIGFIEASQHIGYQIAAFDKPWLLVLVGTVFGIITIPAEPSVHILTNQIEDNTAGSIKAMRVMITLCLGVAAAVGLSMLRILIPCLELWHILLPGMIIVIALSFFTPNLFVGIAYDSGGVAAGTMTSVFILPFAHGAAEFIPRANIVQDGFGIIALVALTPLIAVQLLGLIYKVKSSPLLSETLEVGEDLEDKNDGSN